MPKISIIIPTLGCHSIAALFESLRSQSEEDFEALVVFNGVHPPSKKPSDSRFRMISSALGANRARNAGMLNANPGSELFLFLDDDCLLPSREFLAARIALHQGLPEAAAIGGAYSLPAKANLAERTYHSCQLEWLAAGWCGKPALGVPVKTKHLLGGNLSIKRTALSELLFDEAMIYGGTETQLLAQLSARGLSLYYSDDSPVVHGARFGLGTLLRKGYSQGQGKAYIERSSLIAERRMAVVASQRNSRSLLQAMFARAFQLGYSGRKSSFLFLRVAGGMASEAMLPKSWTWFSSLFSFLRAALDLKKRVE